MVPKNPKVKFVINASQDIENYILFRKYSLPKFLRSFLPTELHYILNKDLSKKTVERAVRKYVKDTFRTNEKEILGHIADTQKQWRTLEKKYFDLVNKIFKGHPWPKGKYIGFASVFEMFPRDIKEKTFYFPALRTNSHLGVATTSHEMLHFMFFDYLKARYGINEEDEFKNKNPLYLWNVSETFNLVMESWKPYQDILKTGGKPYDRTHAKMLPKMKKLWKKKNDIDDLLHYYFKFSKASSRQ